MAVMSGRVFRVLDPPDDSERRPGSIDVEWAERAFRDHKGTGISTSRRVHRPQPAVGHRLRKLVIAFALTLASVGAGLAATSQGSPATPITHTPAPVQSAKPPSRATAGLDGSDLGPTLSKLFASLQQTPGDQKR